MANDVAPHPMTAFWASLRIVVADATSVSDSLSIFFRDRSFARAVKMPGNVAIATHRERLFAL